MVAGFTSVGMDVLLLGPMPTPAVAMLTRSMRADLGVMISASHNPYEDNGIKLFGPDGYKLSDEVEREIEALIDSDLDARASPARTTLGRAKRIDSVARPLYRVRQAHPAAQRDLDGLRIVVDCANGAAYKVAPEALWELGAEVITIGVEPERLQHQPRCRLDRARRRWSHKVRELRADIGIALDGDADRVLIVDEKGQVVDGDQLMAVIARSWQEDGRLSAAGHRRHRHVQSRPGALSRRARPRRWRAPRSATATCSSTCAARLQSRRRAVRPHHPVGLRARPATASSRRCRCSPWSSGMDKPVSRGLPLLRAAAADPQERPLQGGQAAARSSRSSARSRPREQLLGKSGRLVIRPSGTEPVIRVMAEGDDRDLVERVVDDVVDAVTKAAA